MKVQPSKPLTEADQHRIAGIRDAMNDQESRYETLRSQRSPYADDYRIGYGILDGLIREVLSEASEKRAAG